MELKTLIKLLVNRKIVSASVTKKIKITKWFEKSFLGAQKLKGYDGDDGLINDNESDAETGAALKEKKRRKKKEPRARGMTRFSSLYFLKLKILVQSEDQPRERPGQYKSAAMVGSDDSSTDEDFNPNKKVMFFSKKKVFNEYSKGLRLRQWR